MSAFDSTSVSQPHLSRSVSKLLSKREVAQHLGVSPRTIDNWIADQRIPYLKLSPRVVRFDPNQVAGALARCQVRAVREVNGLRKRQPGAVVCC